jgi:hypothetical protein
MPQCKMVCHALPRAKLCIAALMLAGYWLEIVELLVTVGAKRFELGNVPIAKWLA